MRTVLSLFLIVAMATLGTVAAAQDPPPGTSVLMTADCAGGDVLLSIDFNVTQAPPPELVGWVIERDVIGFCAEKVLVTDVMEWPAEGQTHLDLVITPDIGWFDSVYRIWATDAEGNLTFIAWPQRHSFAHAECMPGPSAVGRFVDWAGYPYFEVCEENCWWELSPWDGSYPPEAPDLIESGAVVNLHGPLIMGMHGVYIETTFWTYSSLPCDPVASAGTSWGSLKSTYR